RGGAFCGNVLRKHSRGRHAPALSGLRALVERSRPGGAHGGALHAAGLTHNLTPGNIGPARGAVGHTAAFLGACAPDESAGRAGARTAVACRDLWPRSVDTR